MNDGCDFCNGKAAARGSNDTYASLSGDIVMIKSDVTEDLENAGFSVFDYVDGGKAEIIHAYRINFCPYCGKPVWRGTEPWTGWR